MLRQILGEVESVNLFNQRYRTAREVINLLPNESLPAWVILNPRMELVLENRTGKRRFNFPTADEVSILIPDEYGDPGC